MLDYFKQASGKKKVILILIILVIIAVVLGGFYFWQKTKPIRPAYSQIYRLVNEKISQSAVITIYLPDNTNKGFAQKNVSFYPEIKGQWLVLESEQEIIFKP